MHVQKLRERRERLQQLGGAEQLVATQSQNWTVRRLCSAIDVQQVPRLLDYLVSTDALDFHSDDETVEINLQQQQQQQQGEAGSSMMSKGSQQATAAAAGGDEEVPTHVPAKHRVVLTHSFRSPLASAMLHALDVQPLPPTSVSVGASLSVRMACALQKRGAETDLGLLFVHQHVHAVAEAGYKKKRTAVISIKGEETDDDIIQHAHTQVEPAAAAAAYTHLTDSSLTVTCM